MEKRWN